MSFQGDVGGIGLADLLQSLARGREGVLTLLARDGSRSTLGIQGGLIHLLPEPDEDPEIWRNRARQAWVKDPDFRIDSLRMTEIARAQRIENVYGLLDSEGVHFRFTPGPLPASPSAPAISASEPGVERKNGRRNAVYCPGMQVESLLLEYARLKDEGIEAARWFHASNDTIPCAAYAECPTPGLERFHAEIDSSSNLVEISDRLGWPLRQLRIVLFGELQRQTLRLALPEEMLALAYHELVDGNYGRAASRLCAWCEFCPPGPADPADAELLATEWQGGRLQAALRTMPVKSARTVLRRVDLTLANPLTAVEHWTELAQHRRDDTISALHLMIAQIRSGADPNVPTMRDLLAVARGFADGKCPLRAGAILRVAAARMPETPAAQLEVGLGMIAAGLVPEGAPWVVEAARAYVAQGQAEKAVAPLRALIDAAPSHRDARRLLARARAGAMKRTLVRKNSLVTFAVLLALSVGAVVTFRSRRAQELQLDEVRARISEPAEALALLDRYFPEDASARIQDLRRQLEERKKTQESAHRTEWTDRYRDAQLECSLGDPLLGLQRALTLPAPPELGAGESWPLTSDLFNGLAARLQNTLDDVGDVADDVEQVRAEHKLAKLVEDLSKLAAKEGSGEEVVAFCARLADLQKQIVRRSDERAQARSDRLKKDNLAKQDLLLAAARAHAEAGDHARALTSYEKLVESDPTGKLAPLLAKEMKNVATRANAVVRARQLSLAGHHLEARDALVAAKEDPRDYLLPWRVETFPAGARARLRDGSIRVTPFDIESSFGERIEMTLELEGHEPLTLDSSEPANHFLYLSRQPERWWKTDGRIEALPVGVGDDHVVCDRSGEIARITKGGEPVWQIKLASLGGIARSPIFLGRKPGYLLLVTEDGEVWLVDAASGTVEGPWSTGSPPVEGPTATSSGARVRFRDGTIAEWDARLKPEILQSAGSAASAPPSDAALTTSSSAGLAVMRRGSGAGKELASPWNEWRLEIGPEVYSVHRGASSEPSFTVRRDGEWSFVAWEAPHARIARGRLWIADGRGLRSFQP